MSRSPTFCYSLGNLKKEMHQLALILRNTHPSVHGFQLLVTPCPSPPPPSADLPFQDSQFFDTPFAPLSPANDVSSQIDPCPVARDIQSALQTIGLTGFDVAEAVSRLKTQLFSIWELLQPWKFWKFLEEPDYGPGTPLCSLFFMTEFQLDCALIPEAAQLLTPQNAWRLLVGKNEGKIRLGPLATYIFSPHFPEGMLHKFNLTVHAQEYPPGVLVLPLKSSTKQPFEKTNLVIFASTDRSEQNALAVACGEALIMDPACHSREAQGQLATVVKSLPKKLLIFLTHHHVDHTEGLPTVQKQNHQAVIVAHELTIRRIGKVASTLKCLPVIDGSLLLVGDQELRVIAAPGHTDGHIALLHEPTQTLIVGDHCVGQGSSVLDSNSGGNMQDYLATTRRFLDISPRMIVPMHGHFNVWPARMLSDYIRHREAREAKILESIERGAKTAFEIVSQVYSDVPTMWMPALSNVKLHVDHLNQFQKLPPDFSMASFRESCGSMFILSCLPTAAGHSFSKIGNIKLGYNLIGKLSLAVLMSSLIYVWIRKKYSS